MATFKALKSTFLIISLIFLLQCSNIVHGHSGHDHEDDGDSENVVDLRSRGLVLVKIWCLIIMFTTVFIGGVSPYFFRWDETFLLLGLQFAAGVFLGTAMMHFLSDSNETFGDLTSKTYPFAFMLASSGYLLTMFADCVIVTIAKRGEKDNRIDVEGGGAEEYSKEAATHLHHGLTRTASWSDSVLLILALCFHSVFEGIAVGVADTKADAWRNLWTISLHKIFAAVGMGIALLKMIPKRPLLTTVAYSLAFAISSPIGIGIGIAINATTQGRTADWLYAISMGLACGVFVYVAINHLMAKGFKPQASNYFDTPFYKFFAVLLGVAVIAVVMIWD